MARTKRANKWWRATNGIMGELVCLLAKSSDTTIMLDNTNNTALS